MFNKQLHFKLIFLNFILWYLFVFLLLQLSNQIKSISVAFISIRACIMFSSYEQKYTKLPGSKKYSFCLIAFDLLNCYFAQSCPATPECNNQDNQPEPTADSRIGETEEAQDGATPGNLMGGSPALLLEMSNGSSCKLNDVFSYPMRMLIIKWLGSSTFISKHFTHLVVFLFFYIFFTCI